MSKQQKQNALWQAYFWAQSQAAEAFAYAEASGAPWSWRRYNIYLRISRNYLRAAMAV
jgi:hypothetical protein